jgi:hypothetical protein
VNTGFWWGSQRETGPVIDMRMIFEWIFMNWDGEVWVGLIWLKIGTRGRLL